MTTRDWVQSILFWNLMVALSLIWLLAHDVGRSTTSDHVVAFGPLAGVVLMFAAVMAYDRRLKRRHSRQESK
jgi:positive regulator of sigma E activity